MKKILKSRIFIFVLGLVIAGSIGVYATIKVQSSEIGYKDGTVEDALDDLYKKADTSKVATQVATLTTQGATYTMANDGYVVGNSTGGSGYAAMIFFSSDVVHVSENGVTRTVSIWAPKGTVVNTRQGWGAYNLTVYEFK